MEEEEDVDEREEEEEKVVLTACSRYTDSFPMLCEYVLLFSLLISHHSHTCCFNIAGAPLSSLPHLAPSLPPPPPSPAPITLISLPALMEQCLTQPILLQ